jgi:hypothetical protein
MWVVWRVLAIVQYWVRRVLAELWILLRLPGLSLLLPCLPIWIYACGRPSGKCPRGLSHAFLSCGAALQTRRLDCSSRNRASYASSAAAGLCLFQAGGYATHPAICQPDASKNASSARFRSDFDADREHSF